MFAVADSQQLSASSREKSTHLTNSQRILPDNRVVSDYYSSRASAWSPEPNSKYSWPSVETQMKHSSPRALLTLTKRSGTGHSLCATPAKARGLQQPAFPPGHLLTALDLGWHQSLHLLCPPSHLRDASRTDANFAKGRSRESQMPSSLIP